MADLKKKSTQLFDISAYILNSVPTRCTISQTSGDGLEITATGNDPYTNTVCVNGATLGSEFRSACIDVQPSTTYTLSASVLPKCFVSFLNDTFVAVKVFATIPTNATSYTFTTDTSTSKILIRFGADILAGQIAIIDNIMLNEGNQPLPYWQHSLRKLTTATDTFTTIPADIYADGNNATVGLKGNTVQNGTPTPDNPIDVNGVGERTINLLNPYSKATNQGGAERFGGEFPAGTYYIYNGFGENIYYRDGVSTTTSSVVYKDGGSAIVTATDTLVVWHSAGAPTNKIMVVESSEAKPYEPYGYKIPISSANTTTPVYLGEVETTRKIKKLTFTGSEDWQVSSAWKKTNTSVFFYNQQDMENTVNNTKIYVSSDKFNATSRDGLYNGDSNMIAKTGSYAMTIRVSDSIATTASAFKTWLALNPVTVWYVLANEETGIVNEPLMKIGDYADTVSGITIPTITGKDTFDVETALKPSEVSLSYTGWHDVEVKEWDGSQWNE